MIDGLQTRGHQLMATALPPRFAHIVGVLNERRQPGEERLSGCFPLASEFDFCPSFAPSWNTAPEAPGRD
jgi:hypothetical protein